MANSPKMKLKEDILNVLRNSDEMLRSFRNQIENKYVIIFVGNTRNGKSTLVNYITEVPLVAFQDKDDHFRIEHRNGPNVGATIGHGTLSHTTVPTIIEMKERPDTVIIDAPGFDDNRGALQEIINALYINQIKHAKGVRFVLVSDINNIINDNINYFLSFIDTVHTIMPDFGKLKDAVSIIFTKDYKQYSLDEIVKLLKSKILDVNGLRCKKDLIKHFVERNDLIGLFKMPTLAGALTEEINENVHGAIFKSRPINLSTSDIKFGISKSARVVLLETYLDFFDIVLSLKETFEGFRLSTVEKFHCLNRNNLLLLSDTQLIPDDPRGVHQILTNFLDKIKQAEHVSIMEVPDTLKALFLDDLKKVIVLMESIGVEIPNKYEFVADLNTIEKVRQKLEYISLIEKVVEKQDKSRNILTCYQENNRSLQKELREFRYNIQEELNTREKLARKIASIPNITNRLNETHNAYLCASTKSELQKMQQDLELYKTASDQIVTGITRRPFLYQSSTPQIYSVQQICNDIDLKIGSIQQHIEKKNKEVLFKYIPPFFKKIIGTLVLYTGFTIFRDLEETTQLKVCAGSVLLFAVFSWKSVYMRKMLWRIRLRYEQNRLFTGRTKLDGCWKELTS